MCAKKPAVSSNNSNSRCRCKTAAGRHSRLWRATHCRALVCHPPFPSWCVSFFFLSVTPNTPSSPPHTHTLTPPPQTLENTREADVTMVSAGDEEVVLDEADDEFAGRLVCRHGGVWGKQTGLAVRLVCEAAGVGVCIGAINPPWV